MPIKLLYDFSSLSKKMYLFSQAEYKNAKKNILKSQKSAFMVISTSTSRARLYSLEMIHLLGLIRIIC